MVEHEAMEAGCKVIRLRKYYRNLGVCGLILSATMGITCLLVEMDDVPADRELPLLIFFISFFTFLSGAYLWIVLSYYYATLTIHGRNIIEQGVLRRKELDLDHIRQLRWIASPFGGIQLKSLTEKITIHIDNFPCEERLWIVEYLREQIPASAQEGWDLFCHRVALPLRRYDPQALPVPDNDEVLLTRKRWDRLLLPWIPLFTVGGVLAAWKFNQTHLLIAPLLPILIWLSMRYSTPQQGMVSRKISADKETSSLLTFLGGMLAAYMIILVGLKLIDNPRLDHSITILCLTLIWMAAVLCKCHRLDKTRHKKQREQSKRSLEEWEAGSPPSD